MSPRRRPFAAALCACVAVFWAAALPAAALAEPWFAEATERLGSPQPCGGSGCYSHFVTMADLDGDGDLDLVFANGGGYYTPAKPEPLVIYQNDGSGHFADVSATAVGGFAGRVRQVAIGDIDADGDLDLVAPDGYGLAPDAVFVNQGGMVFANQGATRQPVTSRAGACRLGDIDGDDDLDLLITDWGTKPFATPGTAHVYRNDGTGHFAFVPGAFPQDISGSTGPIDLDLVDVDDDQDLDVLLAMRKGDSVLFSNDGGVFQYAIQRLPAQPGPYVYGPDACDVDADGDLDLWLDNAGQGLAEQLCLNDEGYFTDDTSALVTGNPGADDNEVQCADLDNDGDLDAVIASLSDNERVLQNDGLGAFALLPGVFPVRSDSTLGLDLGDVDGDGRLDAVTAQGEGGDFTNRLYLGTALQPTDTLPPVIRMMPELALTLQPGPLRWRFAVQDRATSDIGPRLQRAEVEWQLGDAQQPPVIARFVGGDLFSAVLTLPVLPGGAALQLRACASDVRGQRGCSAWQSAQLYGPPIEADASDATDTSGADAGAVPPASKPASDGCSASGSRSANGRVLCAAIAAVAVLLVCRRRGTGTTLRDCV